MKKLFLAIALTTLAAGPAWAEEWDFILINSTGKPIKTIELAPAGTNDWQPNKVDPDLKREATLRPGGRTTVHFDKGGACKYDVKLTFDDAAAATWRALDVCDNSFVTMLYANGTPSFKAN